MNIPPSYFAQNHPPSPTHTKAKATKKALQGGLKAKKIKSITSDLEALQMGGAAPPPTPRFFLDCKLPLSEAAKKFTFPPQTSPKTRIASPPPPYFVQIQDYEPLPLVFL